MEMSLDDFRAIGYKTYRLPVAQMRLVLRAQDYGVSVDIWSNYMNAALYAKQAVFLACLAFPELRCD